jgi:hypothetical protein
MRRWIALTCGCFLLIGFSAAAEAPAVRDLVFLTRDGCVNTATMRTRFDEALTALRWTKDYQFIDADTLPETDPRRGYGTPTLLYKNVDLFGMPEPRVREDALT